MDRIDIKNLEEVLRDCTPYDGKMNPTKVSFKSYLTLYDTLVKVYQAYRDITTNGVGIRVQNNTQGVNIYIEHNEGVVNVINKSRE